jgi:hypothetical protein
MDLGAILVIFSVLLLVAIFVSRPFFVQEASVAGDRRETDDRERERSELLAGYERSIAALQELDFDNSMGKIPADEYPEQRAALLTAGADALGRLDALRAEAPAQSVEARLEAAIAARRADTTRVQVGGEAASYQFASDQGDSLEEMIANRRQGRVEKSGGFCPRCGKPVQKSDLFCPRCGATLTN